MHRNQIAIKRNIIIAYSCVAAICMIWGTTFLALKIGVRSFPPFFFAFLRQVIAGVLLTTYVVYVMKIKWPPLNHVLRQAYGGFLLITLGNGLVSWSSPHVPTGVTAIICSLTPVFVTIINLSVNKSESPNLMVVLGILAGISGIIIVFSEHLQDFSNPTYILAIVLIFVATMGWAFASYLTKRSNETVSPFLNGGLQMFFGGIFCLPLSIAFDDFTIMNWSPVTLYSLSYLIFVGSIAAVCMYSYALSQLPLTIATMYAYINPLVAVLLGSLFLSEKLNGKIGVAILITVSGIYLVNRGYARLIKQKA